MNRRNDDQGYVSPYTNWNKDSIGLTPEVWPTPLSGVSWFPQKLIPLLGHAELQTAAPEGKEWIAVQHLIDVLEGGVATELALVNVAASKIAQDFDFLPELDPRLRDDAFKVIVDESVHARSNRVFATHVAEVTGIARAPWAQADRSDSFATRPSEWVALANVFHAACTELVITRTLSQAPSLPCQPATQYCLRIHAFEEGHWHHHYFSQLFVAAWRQISPNERSAIGARLPGWLSAYLTPDVNRLLDYLNAWPGLVHDPLTVAVEVLSAPSTLATIREAAQPAIRVFKHAGVFDDPLIEDLFRLRGLL